MINVYEGIKAVSIGYYASDRSKNREASNDAQFILISVGSLCSTINKIDDTRGREALVSIISHYGFLCEAMYGEVFWKICDGRLHILEKDASKIDVATHLTKIVHSTMLNIRGQQNAELSSFMELCAYVDQRMPGRGGLEND